MYLNPDLTGEDPSCKVDNDMNVVLKTNQRLSFLFDETIYADSLNITLLGTGSTNTPLVKNTDWQITEEDKDYDAMSRLRVYDPSFDKLLIKSVTFLKPVVVEYKLNMSYQRLYPLTTKQTLLHGSVIDVNPALFKEMLERLEYLTTITSPVKDYTSITDQMPRLLDIDPYVEKPENVIIDEIHTVNVPANKMTIHPVCGSFFKGTEKLVLVSTNQKLVEGEHYKVICNNLNKTKVSNHKPGVYDYILVLLPIVGDIKLSYHAYGGDVTVVDARVIEDEVNNIIRFLNQARYITPENIGYVDLITDLCNKFMLLEDEVRRLAKTGRPSYGDVSTGKSILKKIASPDNNLHWWTIATLYKVDGSDEVFVSDRMRFRVSSMHTKMMFDAIVTVNLNADISERFKVEILSDMYPKGYVPFINYDGVDNIIRPQFRIIYNDNTAQYSGVSLQIGMELKLLSEETLAIEDLSGIESCWKLVPEEALATMPQDDLVVLPNPSHTWSEDNEDSREDSTLIPFKEGHLIWAGTEALNRPISGMKVIQLQHFLNKDIDFKKISKVRIDLVERDIQSFPITIEFIPGRGKLSGTTAFSYNGKSAVINVHISRDALSKEIEVVVEANIEAGVGSTQLDMYHVIIFT